MTAFSAPMKIWERLELLGEPYAITSTPAWLRHPNHLSMYCAGWSGKKDPELRPGNVEAIVREIERVTVHHAPLCRAQALFADARLEPVDHCGRPVRREHCSCPGVRPAGLACPSPPRRRGTARPVELDEAERLVRQVDLLGSHVAVVALRDRFEWGGAACSSALAASPGLVPWRLSSCA